MFLGHSLRKYLVDALRVVTHGEEKRGEREWVDEQRGGEGEEEPRYSLLTSFPLSLEESANQRGLCGLGLPGCPIRRGHRRTCWHPQSRDSQPGMGGRVNHPHAFMPNAGRRQANYGTAHKHTNHANGHQSVSVTQPRRHYLLLSHGVEFRASSPPSGQNRGLQGAALLQPGR